MSRNRLVVIGQAVKSFGVKGEIKIRPFTESREVFQRSSRLIFDNSSFAVLSTRNHGGMVIVSLSGVDVPEDAQRLVGALVKTELANFPAKQEDEYYWFELIGLRVVTVRGVNLGEIKEIIRTGASDVLSVRGGKYEEILLPMIEDVIIHVNLQEGTMIVDPLDGMVPDV